jgi:uncharacterized protein (DUF305 family)
MSEQNTPLTWVGVAAGIVLVAVVAFFVGRAQPNRPGPDSADVGFARDMSLHHANAVEMALIIMERTDDEVMQAVATDILQTQQNQIGQMQALLTRWGYSIGSPEAPMRWMGMEVDGMMPGIVGPEGLNELRDLEGVEADALFLELMILHHESGIAMAEAMVEMGSDEQLIRLAQSMIRGQQEEIDLMQDLRQEKGYPPVELPDSMQDMMDDQP